MSDSLQPHGLQHTRLPCPLLSPGVAQTHVYQVVDAIQPSHPLLPPIPPALSLSQHQGLFQWVSSSHQVAKESTGASASASVFPVNIPDWFPLGWTCLISLLSKGLSGVFSSTTIWNHQFFGTQPSLWSNSYIHIKLLQKPLPSTFSPSICHEVMGPELLDKKWKRRVKKLA